MFSKLIKCTLQTILGSVQYIIIFKLIYHLTSFNFSDCCFPSVTYYFSFIFFTFCSRSFGFVLVCVKVLTHVDAVAEDDFPAHSFDPSNISSGDPKCAFILRLKNFYNRFQISFPPLENSLE